MARQKLCVGVDIGASSIKLCQLRQTRQGLVVDRFGMAALPPDTVVDGALMNAGQAIDALKQLLGQQKLKNRDVALSISGTAVTIKKIQLPVMTADELAANIAFEAEQLIPFDIRDVFLDTHIIGPSTNTPSQMDVILVAAKKDFVNDYTQLIRDAGLNPVVCDVDAFALQNSFFNSYEQQYRCAALVNVGASKMNINVLLGEHSMFTRDVSLGGSALNQSIQQNLRISFEEAESLKLGQLAEIEAGRAAIPEVEQAIENTAFELANEIQNSLDFYTASSADGQVDAIYLSGGSGHMAPLVDTLKRRLGIAVECINPFRKMAPGDISAAQLATVAASATIVVGLAQRYAGDS